jgi:NTE family protein
MSDDLKADLVLEGGGVKGIGLVGALAALEERGYVAQNLAGTSAGAIVATLLAAKYEADELHEIMKNLQFNEFMDKGWEDHLPGGKGLSIILDQGIYEGKRFEEWIRELLEKKNVRTFSDLTHPEFNGHPRYGYRVQVIVSDLTSKRLLVLPKDADALGVEPNDLDVAQAVRMSMSIPIFFEPVRWKNPSTGEWHVIVDGGMLSNFPVWLFDTNEEPEWPTFGLRLAEPQKTRTLARELPEETPSHVGIRATVRYLWSLVATMMAAHDRLYLDQADYARTIPIPVSGVKATDFELSKEKSEELYTNGKAAAEQFLDQWNFNEYIEAFRKGRQSSRRQQLSRYMKDVAASSLAPGESNGAPNNT